MNELDDKDFTPLIERLGREMDRANRLQQRLDEVLADNTRLVMERRRSLRAMVREFNATFGVPMPESPGFPDEKTIALRCALIWEEYGELVSAIGKRDLVGVADACGDLAYVVEGCAQAFGIDSGPVLKEIQRSNLTKTADGKRADGKIAKGESYSPPDLRSVLVAQGMKPEAA